MDREYISILDKRKINLAYFKNKSEENVLRGIEKRLEGVDSKELVVGNYYIIRNKENPSIKGLIVKFIEYEYNQFGEKQDVIIEKKNGIRVNQKIKSDWRFFEEQFSRERVPYDQLFLFTVKGKMFFSLDINKDGVINSIREEIG